jgi:hypothetical protein
VDEHMCPTREPKQGPEDQGYREAKAVLAFGSVPDLLARSFILGCQTHSDS